MFDEAFTPRGSVGASSETSESRRSPDQRRSPEAQAKPAVSSATFPRAGPAPFLGDEGEFDRLWNDARRIRKTTTTRKRVVKRSPDSADTDPEVDEMGKLRPRRQSRSHFTETEHNGMVNLIFNLPGVPKADVKVKFATQKITVAWQKVTVEEKTEGERLIRERVEKKYLRTIPIPPAVPFDTVRAVLQDERLTITYPRIDILK